MFDIKPIVLDSNPSLRKKSVEVKAPYSKEDIDTALYLRDYLVFAMDEENVEKYHLRSGVGLAAPQIGINKRMCAIHIEYPEDSEKGIKAYTVEYSFINPKIIAHSARLAYLTGGEGCLSVDKDHEGFVPRYAFVTVSGYDVLTKKDITVKLRGYDAIVIQHEIDHLDGVLFYDHINKKDPYQRIEGALEI